MFKTKERWPKEYLRIKIQNMNSTRRSKNHHTKNPTSHKFELNIHQNNKPTTEKADNFDLFSTKVAETENQLSN